MNLHMVGCSHHATGIDLLQQLAFGDEQAAGALGRWREELPDTEMVLLSTCNRVELYAGRLGDATAGEPLPDNLPDQMARTLVDFHELPLERIESQLVTLSGPDVVSHLYRVTGSLDSMVVGEPQILAQVKQAYQRADAAGLVGPLMHDLFQSALRSARRVASETRLHKHRVSIPSVAIADFATQVFERFDDKHVLVVGAGEMAEETLTYLRDAGARKIHLINRNPERGERLAERFNGICRPWEALWEELVAADLVISTTAATEPIVTADAFTEHVEPGRQQRPLFVLDLSVPRDFDPQVGESIGVYLYSLDDLSQACERNKQVRQKELPAAEQIIAQETERFLADTHHRATAPIITGLRRELLQPKEAELERLFNKLPNLDDQSREEIRHFADRLVNKMLHPPMQSLREATANNTHHTLLDALRRLFQLKE